MSIPISSRSQAWIVLAAVPVTILAALAGGGVLGGFAVQNASGGALSATATPLAPASRAFSIWSVIYLGLTAAAIWQVLPRNRETARVRDISWLFVASLALNALWIIVALAGLLPLTVVVIAALLIVNVLIIGRLHRTTPSSRVEAVVIDGTFGLYLGWICVATFANVAALLADAGFRPAAWQLLGVTALLLIAAVGALIAVRTQGRLAPAIAIVWGVAWIGIARVTTAPSSVALGITAAIVCALVAGFTLIVKTRARSA